MILSLITIVKIYGESDLFGVILLGAFPSPFSHGSGYIREKNLLSTLVSISRLLRGLRSLNIEGLHPDTKFVLSMLVHS